MSKELEKIAKGQYLNTLINAKNLCDLRTLGIERKGYIKHALSWAIEKEIPPTSEEVCKALENYFGFTHYYQDNFFYRSDGMKYIWAVKRSGVLEIGHVYETLPTHLFIMIGKFYESEVSKNV